MAARSAEGARLRAAARSNLLGSPAIVYRRDAQRGAGASQDAVEGGVELLAAKVEDVRTEKDMDFKEAVRPWPRKEIDGKTWLLLQLESKIAKESEGFDDFDDDDDDNELVSNIMDHSIVSLETGDVYDITADRKPELKFGVRANVLDPTSIEHIVDPHTGVLRLFGDTVAELVLSLGVPVDSTSTLGETALIQASSAANLDVCKWLVEEGGANARAATRTGTTSLHMAADLGSKDHEEVARLLAGPGKADVNAANAWGLTPLHIAAFRGNLSMVQLLLELGADNSRKDDDGKTPSDYAREDTCYKSPDGTVHYSAEVEQALS
ncbi:Ankyrin repeat domain-containing protein 1 [Hondaea fermentalgiana]|uniref:Ankyrin repeat domain-containing protein 1 n=1 Tax=Hondaea fermentalgiana TaxID=2315210 RepID=A0A2R5GQP5_9STRA|nr:Ankyrin repeat domain-containing protein 1 [Hondaea fermentalgiana]|eukprot:GBG33197.1 Ankyrin repeat domain-containing protein 1 [Hondaea fermentalgiana]